MSLNLERKLLEEKQEWKDKGKKKKEPGERGPPPKLFKTAAEEQAWRIQKLLEDPERPVFIPTAAPQKRRAPRAAVDFNDTVGGSTAGAGSGEFHVYRQTKEKEHKRLQHMDAQAAETKAKSDYEAKKRRLAEEDESKTAKKRAKRQRLKRNQEEAKRKQKMADERAKLKAEADKEESEANGAE
eukprot:gene8504-30820_t